MKREIQIHEIAEVSHNLDGIRLDAGSSFTCFPDVFCFKVDGKDFVVEIIDQVDDYLEMMKNIFDFDMIKQYLKSNKVLLNSLHGGN